MSVRENTRVSEARLTGGLATVYKYGYISVLVLMMAGILYPLLGWRPAETIYTAGIILLLSVPLISTLWVGFKAIRNRDRGLIAVVAGILVLVIVARLVSSLI